MKRLLACLLTLILFVNVNAFSAEKRGVLDKIEGGLDRIFGQEVETKTDVKQKKQKKFIKTKALKTRWLLSLVSKKKEAPSTN